MSAAGRAAQNIANTLRQAKAERLLAEVAPGTPRNGGGQLVVMRNEGCAHWSDCLRVAALLDWRTIDCGGCSARIGGVAIAPKVAPIEEPTPITGAQEKPMPQPKKKGAKSKPQRAQPPPVATPRPRAEPAAFTIIMGATEIAHAKDDHELAACLDGRDEHDALVFRGEPLPWRLERRVVLDVEIVAPAARASARASQVASSTGGRPRERILARLRELGAPATRLELGKPLGLSANQVHASLKTLINDGLAQRVAHGKFTAVATD